MRFRVLVAAHNRAALTTRALRAFADSAIRAGVDVSFHLYDDGSTDSTAEKALALGLDVEVIEGDGSAFWASSMASAERAALASTPPADTIVWLNDDVATDPDAVTRVMPLLASGQIVVGAMRELGSSAISYSGYRSAGVNPLKLRVVLPDAEPRELDTFNGNLVFVPAQIAEMVGGIDGGFAHALADIDYGLRAKTLGVPMVLAAGTLGECARNPPAAPAPISTEWARFLSRKYGGHPASMARVLKRHSPVIWPALMATTYVLWWVRALGRLVARGFRYKAADSGQ